MTAATLHLGDCLDFLPTLEAGSVDAVVTDPPYGLEFMGKEWDKFDVRGKKPRINAGTYEKMSKAGRPAGWAAGGNPACRNCGGDKYRNGSRKCVCDRPDFPNHSGEQNAVYQEWCFDWAAAALRVLKPGGYLLAFGGTRTFHRLACALEDAGFEMRDTLMWLHGQGFPKGKGCLKPAFEPVALCRRPGPKVLPLGIEECRVGTETVKNGNGRFGFRYTKGNLTGSEENKTADGRNAANAAAYKQNIRDESVEYEVAGRWPANLILSEEAARLLDEQAGERRGGRHNRGQKLSAGWRAAEGREDAVDLGGDERGYDDSGGPSRFFYCSKAPRRERVAAADGIRHPTQKPEALMRWLVKLVCPPGGLCLDPFAGSGTTGVACVQAGRRFVGCELDPGYVEVARRRIEQAQADCPLFVEPLP